MVREWRFHLTGGAPCLDLANTVSWRRSARPIERLGSLRDLSAWATQAGLISGRERREIDRLYAADPRMARRTLARVRSLREAVFAVFGALSERRPPPERERRLLEARIQQAVAGSRLARRNGIYGWTPAPDTEPMQRLLATVTLSAAELLTSASLDRIGQCGGRDCRWLWLDLTKNRSRRWCDMAVCGNRAKARRFYHRHMRKQTAQ